MFLLFKNHLKFYLILLILLSNCQEPLKTHGIVYLENRANKLIVNKSNKNDVVKIFGQPQIINGDKNDITWIYMERILSKGKYHKLGQHILKENNILILDFNKYGVLKSKKLLNKDQINKIKFSDKNTENELAQRSFIQNFLQSIRQKMYGNRK
tara:strand:- start:727 stop:1188 length:462 start_codon:yes stop_codon:yes gene_type:complete